MKTVLVTGATGCIGSNLAIRLLQRGYNVRALHRTHANPLTLRNVDVEHIFGDIRDKDLLRNAVRGCDIVFHTAALVSFWKKRRDEQMAVNVEGTRNVVECCLEAHVGKLVHTSSVAALGYRTDGHLIDETTAFNWGPTVAYKYSKHLAEREVLNGSAGGLNATIVNPAVVIGPRDQYVHGGQIVLDVKRGRIRAYIEGGMNVVSVNDVVDGHIAAAAKGRSGERYILGGENLTHREVFSLAARAVGGKAPALKAPVWILKTVARISELAGTMLRREPWITTDLVSGAGQCHWYSSEKSRLELDYHPTSVENAMREAYEWYVENGMIRT